MKYLSLGLFACMVLITIGYANSADELHEADLRDAQWQLEQQMAEEEAAAARQGTVSAGAPAETGQN